VKKRSLLGRLVLLSGMVASIAAPVRGDDVSACGDLDFDGDGSGGQFGDYEAQYGAGTDVAGMGSMAGWNFGLGQFCGGCTKNNFINDDQRLVNLGDEVIGTPFEGEDDTEPTVDSKDATDSTTGDEETQNTEGDNDNTSDYKSPCSGNPVQLATGIKTESALDLTLALPNRDFAITRSYSSAVNGGGLVGAGWTLSVFQYVDERPDGTLSLRGASAITARSFRYDGASNRWLAGGPSDEYIEAATLTAQGRTRNVWRLVRPGKGVMDYYRAGGGTPTELVGMIAEDRDLYGGRWIYDYTIFGTANPVARLRRVRMYVAGQTEFQVPIAEVRFSWMMLTQSAFDHSDWNGKLNFVFAVRFDAAGNAKIVNKVQYRYFHFPFSVWQAPGGNGGGGGGGGGGSGGIGLRGDETFDPRTPSMVVPDPARASHAGETPEPGSELGGANEFRPPYPGNTGPMFGPDASDVGSPGDLIQVDTYEPVDPRPRTGAYSTEDMVADLPWRISPTHYRYYGANTPVTGPDGQALVGQRHQLKMVVRNEQIESIARYQVGGTPRPGQIMDAANLLFHASDTAVFSATESYTPYSYHSLSVMQLASKIVGYDGNVAPDAKVTTQYLQSACGCGGNGIGTKLTYDYAAPYTVLTPNDGLSTRIDTWVWNDSTQSFSTLQTKQYSDMRRLGPDQVPYLVTQALVDGSNSSTRWVNRTDYDEDTNPSNSVRTLIRESQPSACANYVAFDESGTGRPIYTARTNAGVVHEYTYNAQGRRLETRIRNGTSGNSILTQRTTYPSSNGLNQRVYLPSRFELFRVEGSTNANDIETMNVAYWFRGGDALAAIRTTQETELVAENGPDVAPSYEEWQLFDARGDGLWARKEDKALTYTGRDIATGEVVLKVMNANPAGQSGANPALVGADFGGIDVSGWGRVASGGSLVTRMTLDAVGRVRSVTSPTGDVATTLREIRRDEVYDNLETYAVVTLPHRLSSEQFLAPLQVDYLNVAGKVIRSSTFELDPAAPYDPANSIYTVAIDSSYGTPKELTRTTTNYSATGLKLRENRWHVIRDNFYTTTSYSYDALGRLTEVIEPTGTIFANMSFDALDRVTSSGAGLSSQTLVENMRFVYDGNGTLTSGVGDGNLTASIESTGEAGASPLAPAERVTRYTYDWRNRPVVVQNALPPHMAYAYDNLDRVTREAIFSAVPTSVGGVTSATREDFKDVLYNQRGLVYNVRRAINARDTSQGYLESQRWYDDVGRVAAVWNPSLAIRKFAYDGLGRNVTQYITDRRGDAAPGTPGSYASAVTPSGVTGSADSDSVIEQVTQSYDSFGRLRLKTSAQRNHDAVDGGGPLTTANSVVTYLGFVYDASRMVATIDFGTNTTTDTYKSNATAPVVPTVVPSRSSGAYASTQIVDFTYNARGLIETIRNQKGLVYRNGYDDRNRVAYTIENELATSPVELYYTNWDNRWNVNSSPITGRTDVNRVTTFSYDGSDNLVRRGDFSPPDDYPYNYEERATEYVYNYQNVYGTTTAGQPADLGASLIARNDQLHEIRFGDPVYGNIDPSNPSLRVRFAYDRLGTMRSSIDHNQSRHVFSRDAMGRTTRDAIAAFGANVDARYGAISTTYDLLGRPQLITTHAVPSSGIAANQVAMRYDQLGRATGFYQDHDGPVQLTTPGNYSSAPIGNTKLVAFTYDTKNAAAGNRTRLITMAYPDGTAVDASYGAAGSISDRINRPSGLTAREGNLGTVPLASYGFVGLARLAGVDLASLGLQQDSTVGSTGARRFGGVSTGPLGEYAGYDRFGRTRTRQWLDRESGAGTNNLPTRPQAYAERNAYDPMSNRVALLGERVGDKSADRDSELRYDQLNRLVSHLRGVAADNKINTFAPGSLEWQLDTSGSWQRIRQDLNGDGAFDGSGDGLETRAHDRWNRMVTRATSVWTQQQEFDNNGNITSYRRGNRAYTSRYDAWNRPISISSTVGSSTTQVTNAYNGMHFRIFTATSVNGAGESRVLLYTPSWQLIQEEVYAGLTGNGTATRVISQFWGMRGKDDALARVVRRPQVLAEVDPRIDTDPGIDITPRRDGLPGSVPNDLGTPPAPIIAPNGETRLTKTDNRVQIITPRLRSTSAIYYQLTDSQGSVVAIVDSSRRIVERLSYDAYGMPRYVAGSVVINAESVDADLAYVTSILGKRIGESGYDSRADLNRDGVINAADQTLVTTYRYKPSSDLISNPAWADNTVGYSGYQYVSSTGMYSVRMRWLDPESGRWLQRDPMGYVNGAGLYQYVTSSPFGFVDPYGLESSFWDDMWFIFVEATPEQQAEIAGAAAEGALGGLEIAADAYTLGLTDALGITDTSQYDGDPTYDGSRIAAQIGAFAAHTAAGAGLAKLACGVGPAAEAARALIALQKAAANAATAQTVADMMYALAHGDYECAKKLAMQAGVDAALGLILSKMPGSCFEEGTMVATGDGPVAIESVNVGDRVIAPQDAKSDVGSGDTVVNTATWRKATLAMQAPGSSGDIIELEVLRPEATWRELGAVAGGMVDLALPELGVEGQAKVLALEACPAIASGPGNVVLTKMTSRSNTLVSLRVEGFETPIVCTDEHPIYSEDAESFVPAGTLEVGSLVQTSSGVAKIASIERETRLARVINLEVEGVHMYRVGESGLVVHNGGPNDPIPPYNRKRDYGNTPTKGDRKAIGAGPGQVADHDPPLVKRYYEGDPSRGEKPGHQMTPEERRASGKDRSRMKVQPKADSNKQGAEMAKYSKGQKNKFCK
jgi:RHS repeat-associated protein